MNRSSRELVVGFLIAVGIVTVLLGSITFGIAVLVNYFNPPKVEQGANITMGKEESIPLLQVDCKGEVRALGTPVPEEFVGKAIKELMPMTHGCKELTVGLP